MLKFDLKEVKLKQVLFLLVGIFIDQFGVAMCARANFGISAVTFFSYSLNQAVPSVTFGTWSFLFQVCLTLALIVITREFGIQNILAFGVSFISGKVLDLMNRVASHLPMALPLRIIWCGLGIFLIAFGVCLTIESGLPIQPKDMFNRELSRIKGWKYKIIKTIFDICCVTVGCAVLLIFCGRITGIGVGTLISALVMGSVTAWIRKWLLKLHIIEKSMVN